MKKLAIHAEVVGTHIQPFGKPLSIFAFVNWHHYDVKMTENEAGSQKQKSTMASKRLILCETGAAISPPPRGVAPSRRQNVHVNQKDESRAHSAHENA